MNKRYRIIRTFIALEISEELKVLLSDLQSRLRKEEVHASWVRPAAMHLTLKFIGGLDETELHPLTEALGEIGSRIPPFTLRSEDLGAF
ncbi:MAG: 2'-5' RNA ligase family protein, partial [Thermodesulfobacteriota bacterium]